MIRTPRLVVLTAVVTLVGAACTGSTNSETAGSGSSSDSPATVLTTVLTTVPTSTPDTANETANEIVSATELDTTGETVDDTAGEASSGPPDFAELTAVDATIDGTVVDAVASRPELSLFGEAIENSSLDPIITSADFQFTLFAPSNEAFERAAAELGVPVDELVDRSYANDIVAYSVAFGELSIADLISRDGQELESLDGAPLNVTVESGTVKLNGATVAGVDLVASNGMVHIIDTVLLPPDEPATEEAAPTDLLNTVLAEQGESIFVQALMQSGVAFELPASARMTLFAPTDAAFKQASADLGMTVDELLANTELLETVVSYHLVDGVYTAADLVELNGTQLTTTEGSPVTITVDGDTIMVNDAVVTKPDLTATNGVAHVIDKVLLPPN